MWIKANYNDLLALSEAMYIRPEGSISKYLFYVVEINGFGYTQWTQQIENNITFDFEIVTELPNQETI